MKGVTTVSAMKLPIVLAAAVSLLIPTSISASGPPATAEFVGTETCATCHDENVSAFWESTHGILFQNSEKYSTNVCESCHGPGSAHVEEGDPELIFKFSDVADSDAEAQCLSCHSQPKFMDWQFSSHHIGDVSCASCHSGHAKSGHALKKDSPDLCYDCHIDVRADFYMPSRHPVTEGKMSCESCHAIHGEENSWVMGMDEREQCLTCHAEKEGPFIFEHDPVNEECTLCHSPHGSVADNLLVQNEPALCLNCHSMHFHASIPGIESGGFNAPQDPSIRITSTRDSFKMGMLTKCTQCHTQIHGSDLPSQSISGKGTSLTR